MHGDITQTNFITKPRFKMQFADFIVNEFPRKRTPEKKTGMKTT